jgi:hypothetical protein
MASLVAFTPETSTPIVSVPERELAAAPGPVQAPPPSAVASGLGSTCRGGRGRPSRAAPRLGGVRNRSKFRHHGPEARRLKVTRTSRRLSNRLCDAVRSIEETAAAKQAKKQAKKATRDGARRVLERRDDPTQ